MSDTDCEIEFLDEDAEVVQKCVTNPPAPLYPIEDFEEKLPTLLIERSVGKPAKKCKADQSKVKLEEPDSDYDPSEDLKPAPSIKKKPSARTRSSAKTVNTYQKSKPAKPVDAVKTKPAVDQKLLSSRELLARKRMVLKIPDYDDPLCMPVKPFKIYNDDVKKLNRWNKLCVDHMRHAETVLKFDKGQVTSSQRTIVLRDVAKTPVPGKPEIHVWSKTTVVSNLKQKKSEIFQSILPNYREKKQLKFTCPTRASRRFRNVEEVMLTKESHKDGDVLVIYKPKENLSAVYKPENDSDLENDDEENGPMLRGIKELTCNRICAPCYQTSWRGFKKNNNDSTICPICKLSLVSVYNLLSHLRCSHQPSDVKKYRRHIAKTLAKTVGYHYKCRICHQNYIGIIELRKHIKTHKGTEQFYCEIGSHLTQ